MKCFYHNDNDGLVSAAIVAQKYPHGKYIPINYNVSFPIEIIEEAEIVYIVDFSIEPETMEQLLKITPNVFWIDHHKTAIEKLKDFENIKGIRNVYNAGCVLTWWHINPGVEVPKIVKFVEDRDLWAWKYGNSTRDANFNLQALNLKPTDSMWIELFKNYENVLELGANINNFIESQYDQLAPNIGTINWECYDWQILNSSLFGSEGFRAEENYYLIRYYYNHPTRKWVISLYSDKIDVSIIAKKYGGGGHTGAAGFTCDSLPWEDEKLAQVQYVLFKNKTHLHPTDTLKIFIYASVNSDYIKICEKDQPIRLIPMDQVEEFNVN